jgi:hypothetical protein
VLEIANFANAYKRFAITFEDLPVARFDPFQPDERLEWTEEIAGYVNAVGAAIPID